jgi:hypothetical protein
MGMEEEKGWSLEMRGLVEISGVFGCVTTVWYT